MNTDSPQYRAVRDIAVVLLRPAPHPTQEFVRHCVDQALKALGHPPDIEEETLVSDLLHSFNVFGGSISALDDPKGHEDWLPEKRGGIIWNFWRRYETYLEQQKNLPPPVVLALGNFTDDILGRLEDPGKKGDFDRRGMVVGSVQSGKTANYTGLICKAADAGYRIIIILAGMHNNLRSQTQLRIDEGFLGFDTEKHRLLAEDTKRKGVGLLPTANTLHVMSLTSCADAGDFKKNVANTITSTLGGVPTVLVVKKNGRILKTLLEWLLHVGSVHDSIKDKKIIREVPLLLIDDEADQASINTKKDGVDPEDVSTINRRIRELLSAFQKSAYVGYTATPFANIFVNPAAKTQTLEDDIFPRSFILNVRPPGTYCGPARVFGLDADPDTGIEEHEPLPLVNTVSDYETAFPPRHKKDWDPVELPGTLKRAIQCFVLVCAARLARGQRKEHNSMLIHVTRFVAVQDRVTELVRQEFDAIRKRITYGDGNRLPTIHDELRAVWNDEFASRDATLREAAPDQVGAPLKWQQVKAELHAAASKIEIKQINGSARDALDYVNHPDGFSVIAVGGDKLSRGLTLEGLSISYFLRASKMYDTLMQMGRWFGYRPGYLDLCRLFTTADLRLWYRHIALAEEELRREFENMSKRNLTPEAYGLRVREHSSGMIVTALNKMCHSQSLELSFAGSLIQTAHFSTDEKIRIDNVGIVNEFTSSLTKPHEIKTDKGNHLQALLWNNISSQKICDDLLSRFIIHPECHTLDTQRVKDFIQRQRAHGELTTWSLALVSNTLAKKTRPIAGREIGLTERGGEFSPSDSPTRYSTTNANIQSPSHQAFDLSNIELTDEVLSALLAKRDLRADPLFDNADEIFLREMAAEKNVTLDKVALALTRERAARSGKDEPSQANGLVIRQLRPVTNGFILLYAISPAADPLVDGEPPYMGMVISFPSSHTARRISYRANDVLIKQLRDGDYDD